MRGEEKKMNGQKRIGLDEPMGDCRCCIHQDECAPLKQHIQKMGRNAHYRFRCPILIEVDENTEYCKPNIEKKMDSIPYLEQGLRNRDRGDTVL